MAKQQTHDIERYLEKETGILSDVITKQSMRQNAEYSRLNEQVSDVKRIRNELEDGRMECVTKLVRV